MKWCTTDGKYRVESLSPATLSGALNVIRDAFCQDENGAVGSEVNKNPAATDELQQLCAVAALDGVSVVAVNVENDEVVAVAFNKIQFKPRDESEKPFFIDFGEKQCSQVSTHSFLQFMADVEGRCQLFEKYQIDCSFEIMCLATLRSHRNNGLAKLMVKVSIDIARKSKNGPVVPIHVKDLGPKYSHLTPYKPFDSYPKICQAVFTGKGSQCVGKALNFKVIKKRIQEREARKKQTSSNVFKSEGQSTFKSFLDILLDLSETDPSLTENQIKSEVDTVLVGGQETVATALFFTLLMIGCHPDVQDKLYAEIREVLGDRRKANKEDLARMVYAEAVLYETLRMFPPVPVVMRSAHRDLDMGNFTIPHGTTLALNVWGAGRSKRSWGSDAAHFRPERWLPPREPCVAAFLAFSVGRRSCIGKSYALAILKTMLAHCVREFTFHSEAQKMTLKVDIALRPVSGHLLQVKLRNKNK